LTNKKSSKKGSPEIEDPFSRSNTLFFKVPLAFQSHQSSLTQSEKDVYIAFMVQVKYKKVLAIEMPLETLSYWTGIKSIATITSAIKGLAEKGWIQDIQYQKQKANIYHLNLKPKVNNELIEKIKKRSENTSKAKKKSIADGEEGKFEKPE